MQMLQQQQLRNTDGITDIIIATIVITGIIVAW